jgi:MOSC domain-containing protein YiiM
MKLVSLNVGLPGEVQWKGKPVWTGIFKSAVTGPRMLSRLNVEGDAQADLTVHGGIYKAVYGYPVEHYDYWREVLPEMEWKWGAFGKTLQPKAYWKTSSILVNAFGLERPSYK